MRRRQALVCSAVVKIIVGTAIFLYFLSTDLEKAPVLTSYDDQNCQFNYTWRKNDSLTHVQRLADRLRSYIQLSKTLEGCYERATDTSDSQSTFPADFLPKYKELQHNVFPFFKNKNRTIEQWVNSFSGRGIVIPISSNYLRFALVLLRNLQILGCKLPIEVFYKGGELSKLEMAYLKSYGVRLVDITTLVDDRSAGMDGYAVKPFSLVFSSFREVILLDSDVILFRNPEIMFNDKGYRKYGTLLFLDRMYLGGSKLRVDPKWYDQNMPQPLSERIKNTRVYRGVSEFQIEAGVVLMDKRRTIYALLAACTCMTKKERDAWFYHNYLGDKESFWMGFELIDQNYWTHPAHAGVIGKIQANLKTGDPEVCGNVVHPGDDGRPLWLNGGLVAKYRNDYTVQPFAAFAIEGDVDPVSEGSCFEGIPPNNLTAKELNLLQTLGKHWINSEEFVEML